MLDAESHRAAQVAVWLGLPDGTTVRISPKDLRHYVGLLIGLGIEKDFRIWIDRDRFQIWVPQYDDVTDARIVRVFATGVLTIS